MTRVEVMPVICKLLMKKVDPPPISTDVSQAIDLKHKKQQSYKHDLDHQTEEKHQLIDSSLGDTPLSQITSSASL